MHKPRKSPVEKEIPLSEVTKAGIRDRIAQGKQDFDQIATEYACSASQIAGIKAAMTKGGKRSDLHRSDSGEPRPPIF